MLNVNRSAIVAISTPGKKPTAKFNMMIKNDHFQVHKVMFICDTCYKENGIREPCKHKRDSVPDHLGENSELVKSLFGDNEDSHLRDVMGIVDDVGCNCFTEASIRSMATMPRVEIVDPVRFVVVVVDPCAGSKIAETRSSDFCTVAMCGPQPTLVGIDAYDAVSTEDYAPRLVEFLRKIRAMPAFENATFVFDAESGSGFFAGDVQLLIQRNFDNIICMNEIGRKPGTFTGGQAKREMMEITRSLLDLGEIRVYKNLVTTDKSVQSIMSKAVTQLINFERVVKVSQSINVASSITFTGKQHGPDDIAVTMQRALLDMQKFRFSPMYQRYHR